MRILVVGRRSRSATLIFSTVSRKRGRRRRRRRRRNRTCAGVVAALRRGHRRTVCLPKMDGSNAWAEMPSTQQTCRSPFPQRPVRGRRPRQGTERRAATDYLTKALRLRPNCSRAFDAADAPGSPLRVKTNFLRSAIWGARSSDPRGRRAPGQASTFSRAIPSATNI